MKFTIIALAALPALTIAQSVEFALNSWPWNAECKLPDQPRVRPGFVSLPGCTNHTLPAHGSVRVVYDRFEKGVAGYPEEGCQGEPKLFFKPGCASCSGGPTVCEPVEIEIKSFKSFGVE